MSIGICTSLPFKVTGAIERRIREGLEFEKFTERKRSIEAARINKAQSEAVLDPNGMGLRRVLTIPAHEFMRIYQKEGYEAFGDDDFIASFRKYSPEHCTKHTPHKKRMKAQETVIYTGRT